MLIIRSIIRKYICSYYTILVLAFIVRLIWARLIPQLSNAPDEASHWLGVQYISNNFSQPSAEQIVNFKVGAHVLQIQMSYFHMVIVNIFLKLFTSNELVLVYSARIANALLSIVVIINCKKFFEKTFKDSVLANNLSLALAFHPQYVFISSYINNDVFTCWIATLSIIVISDLLNQTSSLSSFDTSNVITHLTSDKFLLFFTVFISVFTKSSLIIYLAFFIVIFILLIVKISSFMYFTYAKKIFSYNRSLQINNYIYHIVFALIGLFFASILYTIYTIKLSIPGITPLSIFEGSLMSQVFVYPNLPKGSYSTIFSSHHVCSYLRTINEMGYWNLVVKGFWGIFDNMSMNMNSVYYNLYLPFMGIFVCGLLGTASSIWKKNNLVLLESVMVIAFILMCFGSLSFSYKIDYQPQGRHFLPIIAIVYYFIARGFQLITGKLVTRMGIIFLLIVSVICSSLYVPLSLFHVYSTI